MPKQLSIPQLIKFAQDYEQYVYEDDPSIAYYEQAMHGYEDEWSNADWNELWSERQRLKDTLNEFLMDETDPPHILRKQIEFINEKINEIDNQRDQHIVNKLVDPKFSDTRQKDKKGKIK